MEYQLIIPKIPLTGEENVVEQVFANRGIQPQNIKHYLNTTNEDICQPSQMMNVAEGAKMLIKHISANDKIWLIVDSDADGFTSSAILLNYLNCLFPAYVRNNIMYRLHEGKQHGILTSEVPEGVKLVIAPDSSSNEYEIHQELAEKGIDVLVLDHHEADKISEYACIINNQLCDYPNKSLSGAGVVYKFCQYIDELMNTDFAENFQDLAALGIISDMMILTEYETRHLIKEGLKNIRNPYFCGMVKKNEYQLKDEVTPFGVSFYITPYINATIRMGSQEEKLLLFESMLDYKGYELIPSTKRGCKGQLESRVEQACRNCTNIKNKQTKIRDENLEIIENIIKSKNLLDNKILVVKLDDLNINKNLTGLIANQLMSKYQRPVLLLNKTIHPLTDPYDIVHWEGSGRGYDKSNLTNFREFLLDTNLVEYAQGHASAFGLGIKDENFNDFIKLTNELLKDFNFSPCYKVDFIWNSQSFNENDIIKLARLKSIWGQGIEEPLICLENITITKDNLTLMSPDKNPTLKIKLPNGTELIKFKSSKEELDYLLENELGYSTINVVGKCERNIWGGNITPQILIEDYEVIKRMGYYF